MTSLPTTTDHPPLLSPAEADQLAHDEAIINEGQVTFLKVGMALARIRDQRLYRAEYDTFEAYVDDRWGFGRTRAYQLIEAGTVADAITRVSTSGGHSEVPNERVARELAAVARRDGIDHAALVLEQAEQRGAVTARGVRDTAASLAAIADAAAQDVDVVELIPAATFTMLTRPAQLAIRWAATAAAGDDTLPALRHVEMTLPGGDHPRYIGEAAAPASPSVTFAATDRYRLAVATITAAGEPAYPSGGDAPTTVLLPAADLLRLVRDWAARGGRHYDRGLRVDVYRDRVVFTDFDAEDEPRSTSVPLGQHDYPDWRRLVRPTEPVTTDSGALHVNPRLLGSLLRAAEAVVGRDGACSITAADGRVSVSLPGGEVRAAAVLMQVRQGEHGGAA